jgi:hypothetical protein
MKNNKKILLTTLLLGTLLAGLYKKNNIIITGNIENEIANVQYDSSAYIIYDNKILDENEINDEIEKLNIENNVYYPTDTYKILQFVDSDNHYKIMVVNLFVNYFKNSDDVISKKYTVVDTFSKTKLFDTEDFVNISNNNILFDNANIISCDNLSKIIDIARLNNVNEEYINYILMNIKNKNLNNTEVARLYVSLININNRVIYDDLNMKNAKIIF